MKRYSTIVADPPWDVRTGPMSGGGMGEGFIGGDGLSRPLTYPTMSVAEIAGLSVPAERDAHLYLWTVNRYIEQAFFVVRAWGFTYSTMLVWRKAPMGGGLGGAFGISTEFCLFCRRGSLPASDRITGTCFDWKRPYRSDGKPAHSTKPDAFLDLVEQVSPEPRLELFARRARFGWDYWGDESLGTAEISEGVA